MAAHAQAPALTYEDRLRHDSFAGGTARSSLPSWTQPTRALIQNWSAGSYGKLETAAEPVGLPWPILILAASALFCMSSVRQAISIIGVTTGPGSRGVARRSTRIVPLAGFGALRRLYAPGDYWSPSCLTLPSAERVINGPSLPPGATLDLNFMTPGTLRSAHHHPRDGAAYIDASGHHSDGGDQCATMGLRGRDHYAMPLIEEAWTTIALNSGDASNTGQPRRLAERREQTASPSPGIRQRHLDGNDARRARFPITLA